MATMNFSIPDDIKERFNQTFANANKSAVVSKLLEEAIERAERKQQSDAAAQRILAGLSNRTAVSEEELRQAREEGRH
jgi:metal-responsive CopG/Arc/MetJ family transcriptional regulator